jgi:RecA-family ATPase
MTTHCRKITTAKELQHMTIQPVRWAVPGILPEGLSLLAGRPKLGKSQLALNIAVSVATGTPVLGVIATEPQHVLYYSLEDPSRRVKKRLTQLVGDMGEWPNSLGFLYDAPLLSRENESSGETLLTELAAFVDDDPKVRLIVVDTLVHVLPERTNKFDF